MQLNSNGYVNVNSTALDKATINAKDKFNAVQKVSDETSEKTPMEEIESAAVKVALSMNAQIVLFAMDSGDLVKNNTTAQKNILDFLSGKNVSDSFNLQNIGYEGKPITKLSAQEAGALIDEGGFFSVDNTSQRVADFVFSFSGDDLELLEKGRTGIIQGFEEAEKMWGGELPQISYDTQAKTLALLDERINQVKGNLES